MRSTLPGSRAGALGLACALSLVLACGASRSSSCPDDLPASCPVPAPSYQTTVAAVVTDRCVTCHGPGGIQYGLPFTTYGEVYANRRDILDQVYNCLMPNIGQGGVALTSDERAALLAWLVCGAPNN